jgi:curved DNA-binding protein CbpA
MAKTSFFKDCTSKQEAKKLFRELAKRFHPDTETGDNDVMVSIIAEYETVMKTLKFAKSEDAGAEKAEQTEEEFKIHVSREMQEIIDNISHLPIDIEVIGTWIWISGNTYPYKSYLTAYNFTWCAKKKMYQWHMENDSPKWRKAPKNIDEIRDIYGTQKVRNVVHEAIAS